MLRSSFTTLRRAAVVAGAAATIAVVGAGTAAAAVFPGDNNNDGQIDKGDTGTAVRCAQQAVIYTGGSVGSSRDDGQFGNNTDAGVRTYQRNHRNPSLGVDGMVGPNTGGAMAADVRAIRTSAIQHGDPDTARLMLQWINTCVTSTYHDQNGHQIFH